VKFFFKPILLNIALTASLGMYQVIATLDRSNSSVLLKYNSQEVCSKKDAVSAFINSVNYISYGTMLISALPCKIVGL